MVGDKEKFNVYKFNTKNTIDIKKVLIFLTTIIFFVLVILTIRNITVIISEYKSFKQYEAQLNALKHQEEEKQRKIAEEQEKIKKERNPILTDEGRKNIENIYKPSDKKIAYLTFDDGPSSVTESILNTLRDEKIKATFFVLGSNVDYRKDIVKRMYDEGHYVANHGYSHVYSQIYSSPQAVLDEYNQCNEIVRNAIENPEYNSHLFRFPGGLVGGKYAELKYEAKELLNQNNIVNIDWNALNGDAETNDLSPEFELQRLSETVGEKESIVILMHDAPLKKVTAETLPQIIAALREKGYEFENFYRIIK